MRVINKIVTWFLCSVVFMGCNERTNEEILIKADKPIVKAQPLSTVKSAYKISASGLLRPDSQINLSFKNPGYIKMIAVEKGDQVKKGKLLGQLDLTEINAKVKEARSGYEQDLRDFKRYQNLYRDSAITLQQLENARMVFEIAKSDLDQAEFNLNHSSIRAPFDGKVLEIFSDPNEFISPSQPLFVFGSAGKSGNQIIELGITDKDIGKISISDSATVYFDTYPQQPFPAQVTRIGEFANPQTGTFEVEVTLKKYYKNLKSGFVAKVEIFPNNASEVYKIPLEALVEGRGYKSKIFITKDRKTVHSLVVPVTVIRDSFFLVPQESFDSFSWIITEGTAYLRESDSITIIQ